MAMYLSNAAKQRAYRINKAIRDACGQINTTTSSPNNLLRVQGQWNKRNGYSIVEQGVLPNNQGSVFLLGKIIAGTLSDSHFLVFLRYYNSVSNENTSYNKYQTLAEAREVFCKLMYVDTVPDEWKNVDHYIVSARNLIWAHKKDSKVKTSVPNRLAFYFAMAEITENGCVFDDKTTLTGTKRKKIPTKKTAKTKITWMRRLVINEVGNYIIPGDSSHDDLIRIGKEVFRKIGEKNIGVGPKVITDLYFQEKCKAIINSLALVGSNYSSLFPSFRGIREELLDAMYDITEYFFDSDDDEENVLKKVKSYPPIKEIEDLKSILDIAWKTNIQIYGALIVELTTLLRPSEARRLFTKRELYLNRDGTLNYTGLNLPEDLWLVQKTKRKIDPPKDLSDPLLSIVGRVILNHPTEDYGNPCIYPSNFFSIEPSKFRWNLKLKKYHERCLRTTGAVMLAYCEKAEFGRATREDVKQRMGHKSRNMVDKVYVKHFPSHALPESFFDMNGDITHDGFVVTTDSFLWDQWLLLDFIDRYCEKYKNNDLKLKKFWDNIIYEAQIYQKIVRKIPRERKNIER